MFNKIKEVFGYKGNQYVVEKTPVVEEVIVEEERVLDISQPVHIIVDKVKENPKRLSFSEVSDYRALSITDTLTGTVVQYTPELDSYFYYSFTWKAELYNKNFHFTQDEVEYIISELKPIYEARQKHLTEIRASRKLRQEQLAREKMQRDWAES